MAIELDIRNSKNNKGQRTVYTRLDMSWYLISAHLDGLKSLCRNDDMEFNRLFNELQNYVEKQFFLQCEGEIVDLYVVAEQIAGE